jgi:hypothetical protein
MQTAAVSELKASYKENRICSDLRLLDAAFRGVFPLFSATVS